VKEQEPDKSLNRRRFCTRIGIGTVVLSAAGGVGLTTSFLAPNVLYETSKIFDAGLPEDYEADSVTLFPKQRAFVVCTPEHEFYAVSAVCTHLGCIVNWKNSEGIIACPCHGSHFELSGEVLTGPATRPLEWFQISLNEDRRLIVDGSIQVDMNTMLRV
jgi:cytochrome b6-f complex iron-sulfur subunit